MQQTANINALKALRERVAVESMRRTFVRHKFAGKSFFFGCITNCLVGMKMGEQKAIEIFVQAPNERTEWSATRSTPNTQTLRETHRNSNAKLFVSPCVNVCLISLFRVNRICICTNFNLALVNVCTILWIYPKKVLFNGICEGVPYKASAYTRSQAMPSTGIVLLFLSFSFHLSFCPS